jgi:hypothetical protein
VLSVPRRLVSAALALILIAGCGSTSDIPPIVTEFKEAYESADMDQIRSLYTEDGILATTDDLFEMYYGDTSLFGTLGQDGSEFVRRGSIHHGEMIVSSAAAIGDNAVSFVWDWEDFASGTAILHLRDGRIAVAVLAVTDVEIEPVGP